MHISSGGSKVVRYCVGLYCFSSHADLHSSTSRLYMSTASSISAYSHLICVISSSVLSSSAGFSFCFKLLLLLRPFSVALLLCRKGFLNLAIGSQFIFLSISSSFYQPFHPCCKFLVRQLCWIDQYLGVGTSWELSTFFIL